MLSAFVRFRLRHFRARRVEDTPTIISAVILFGDVNRHPLHDFSLKEQTSF